METVKTVLAQLNTDIESRIGRGPTQEAFISKKAFKDFFLSDMRSLHCSNKEYPAMDRCTKCRYWFTNLEKRNAK